MDIRWHAFKMVCVKCEKPILPTRQYRLEFSAGGKVRITTACVDCGEATLSTTTEKMMKWCRELDLDDEFANPEVLIRLEEGDTLAPLPKWVM